MPRVGRIQAGERRLNAVVLPAPLGPISACKVRSAHRKIKALARHECRRSSCPDRAPRAPGGRHRSLARNARGSGETSAAPTAGHRGRLDRARAERRDQPLRNADEAGRRKHDEADEQQPEIEQPMRRPDRQKLAEQDEEQRAERRPEEAAHPADHDHGDQLAREGDRDRIGRGEAMVEDRKRAGDRNHCRRDSTKAISL